MEKQSSFKKAISSSKDRWNSTFGKDASLDDKIQGGMAIAQGLQGIAGSFASNNRIADTSGYKSQANGLYNKTSNASSNDQLMSEWNSYVPMRKLSWRDIRGLKKGQAVTNTLGGVASGAMSGASVGGWVGGVIGGVAGLLGGIGGILTGNKKAKRETTKLNRLFEKANLRGARDLWDRTKAVNKQNIFEMESRDYALGGYIPLFGNRTPNNGNFNQSLNRWQGFVPLQTFANGGKIYIKPENRGSFTREAQKRGLGVQEFASRVMANKDDYPSSLVKKANFARNAAHWNAFGGELNTQGADFTNGLVYIDAGGTHVQNPLGGVPMGIAPDGQPNLVEEGEVKWNDFMISNQMKVPKDIQKQIKIFGNNLTYADAAKKAAKESEERPNDPISKNGLNDKMNLIAAAQEMQKMQQQEPQQQQAVVAAFGGELPNMFPLGGFAYNRFTPPGIPPDWITKTNEGSWTWDDLRNINFKNLDTTSQNYLKARALDFDMATKPKDFDLYQFFGVNPGGQLPSGWGEPELPVTEVTGNKPLLRERITGLNNPFNPNSVYPQRNITPPSLKNLNGLSQLEKNMLMDKASKFDYAKALRQFMYDDTKGTIFSQQPKSEALLEGLPQNLLYNPEKSFRGQFASKDKNGTWGFLSQGEWGYTPQDQPEPEEKDNEEEPPKDIKYAPTWMRYAPIGVNSYMALRDSFMNPYYKNIERAEQAAYSIPTVGSSPTGGARAKDVLDSNYDLNQLDALNGATRNAAMQLANTSAPNAFNAILAADYNAGIQRGNLRRQAKQTQFDMDLKTDEFNRQLQEEFKKRDLQAQIANQQRVETMAQQLLKTAQLRDTERIRVADQRDQNWANAGKAFGDLGTENWNRNDVRWAMANDLFGILPDTPMQSVSQSQWNILKNIVKKKHTSALGGKLNKRKKRGLTY